MLRPNRQPRLIVSYGTPEHILRTRCCQVLSTQNYVRSTKFSL